MNDSKQQGPEIIRYIRHNRGERRHLVGAMVAFKRDRTSDIWYIGWSFKHKQDWAIYEWCDCRLVNDCGHNFCPYCEKDIIDSVPFDKSIALNTARKRAIDWNMGPCEANKKPIPDSINAEFQLFLDRAMRYFQTTKMPKWIPDSINNPNFKENVQFLYNDKTEKKENYIKQVENNLDWHTKQVEQLTARLEKLKPNNG